MKKIILLLMASLSMHAFIYAQAQKFEKPHADVEEKAKFLTERMMVKLNLNKEQIEKIQTLNLNRAKRIEDIKSQHGISRQDVRTQIKMLHDEYNKDVKSILTDAQYQKYMSMLDERRERAMARREQHHHKHKHDNEQPK